MAGRFTPQTRVDPMTAKGLLRELLPPVLLRLLKPAKPTPARAISEATEQPVRGGPLIGLTLRVNAAQPAFREMVEGTFDDFLWAATPEHLEGGVILDVGAHIGYHSLGFAARYPACSVVAFEPNPANQERLHQHLVLNPSLAPRITLHPVALSDVEGTLTFMSSANVEDQTSSGGYLQRGSPPLDAATYQRAGFSRSEVPTRRLDDLVHEQGWTAIRMVKLDVEGAEHLVLAGAMETLRRDLPLLLIEVHSVACMLHVLELLHPLGYTTRLLHEDDAFRCFIAASVPHPAPRS